MDTIGILSVLENKLYKDVKKIWNLFERKYGSVGVQTFNHPNITFQGGKTVKLKQLRKDFQETVLKIKPFEINVNGLSHYNKKSIALKVEKTKTLIEINELINQFLKNYCDYLFDYYVPQRWKPHITLAMNDLGEDKFEMAWNELTNLKLE